MGHVATFDHHHKRLVKETVACDSQTMQKKKCLHSNFS